MAESSVSKYCYGVLVGTLLVYGASCTSARVDPGRDSAGAGGAPAIGTAGAASLNAAPPLAAGSGGRDDCRGPGRYESGKEGSYRPCCEGLTEVPVGKMGYSGSSSDALQPVCGGHPPLRVYACVRGTCGDGICEEEGEAPACGCVQDCPQAAFTWDDTTRLGQLSGVPTSCKQDDLLACLLPSDALDCGDLALGASQEERDKSIACARSAFAAMKSFRVFWRTQGEDSIVHSGVIGRVEGDRLRTFVVYVDADAFGIDIQGATAAWQTCRFAPTQFHCDQGPAECLGCVTSYAYDVTCGCLPKGERPGQPPGSSVELRCKLFGT